MSRQRNIRKRRATDEDDDAPGEAVDEDLRQKLEATRDLQKHRQRAQGLGVDRLAGANLQGSGASVVESLRDDEFMGGYIKGQVKQTEEDRDPDREKYIQEQLNKRLGRSKAVETDDAEEKAPPDDLFAIPEGLRTQKATQEDVSTWMTGIVEVPLSLDQKLQNIEQTEAAKKQLLAKAGVRTLEDEEDEPAPVASEKLRRITYPLHFGKHTQKEEDWRQRALQKPQREHKKKRGGP